jgi:hypothetical protein
MQQNASVENNVERSATWYEWKNDIADKVV